MATQGERKDEGPRQGGANIGGAAGSQHNDWGHSVVPTGGNAQSAVAAGGAGDSRHSDWGHSEAGGNAQYQGVIPGEEAGELQTGMGGIGSLSTGNAGSRQSAEDEAGAERKQK
jgi:hypothetical protein